MNIIPVALLISTAALFALAHWVFLETYLYWEYDHLDIFMHVWGGGLIMAVWYTLSPLLRIRQSRSGTLSALILGGGIIAWEVFKYAIGGIVMDNYVADTFVDVLAGLWGGLVVFLIQRSRTIRSS